MRNVNLDTHFTALDVTITEDNVQYLGENIAICSMKHLLPYRNIYKLYNGLIWDMHSLDNYERVITDGYDMAQEAIVYLCQFIGKKLGDMTTNKYGKQITIKHGCASVVGNMIYKHYKIFKNTTPLCVNDKAKAVEPFDETNTEASHDKVEQIIAGMNLTKKQKLTLDCYLKGMREGEVIKLLSPFNRLAQQTTITKEISYVYQNFIFNIRTESFKPFCSYYFILIALYN